MCLGVGALAFFAPPCSSWVFLSRPHTGRTKDSFARIVCVYGTCICSNFAAACPCTPSLDIHASCQENWVGREDNPSVQNANALAMCVLPMLLVAHALEVRWVLEQPLSSLWGYITPIARLYIACGASREVTYLGAYGSTTPKAIKLWSSFGILHVHKPYPCHLRGNRLVAKRGKKVSGKPKLLQQSSAYPPAFCEAIARFVS